MVTCYLLDIVKQSDKGTELNWIIIDALFSIQVYHGSKFRPSFWKLLAFEILLGKP
jgi:hypothetical protein